MPTERRYTGVEAHGTGFRGVYRVTGERHRTATYPTKREAFEARSKALVEARQGLHVDRRRAGMTVDEWFRVWHPYRRIRTVTAEHDAGRWANHVSPYLGKNRLDSLTPYVIDKWMAWMTANGRAPATQKKAFALLKTALGTGGAIGDRRLSVNPCQAVRPPRYQSKEREQMTKAMFESILANIPVEGDRDVVVVGAYAGLRWSEMAGLRRSDYNPLRETVTVSRALVTVKGGQDSNPPKSGLRRSLPVPPRLREVLDRHSEGKGPDDLLFTSSRGTPLSASNFRSRVWEPAVKAAGLDFTYHDLRHAYASWLVEGGVDIYQVKDLMGHASITTTQIYLHATEEGKRAAIMRAFG